MIDDRDEWREREREGGRAKSEQAAWHDDDNDDDDVKGATNILQSSQSRLAELLCYEVTTLPAGFNVKLWIHKFL